MPALSATDIRRDETPLHQLDVRTKMLISVVAAIVVIVLSNPWILASLAVASALYAFLSRRFGVIAIAYGVLGLMWLMAIGFLHLMGLFLPRFGSSGIGSLLVPFLRSAVLMNTLLAMALSSRVQGIMTALKTLHLPYWLYIPATVMIRFIPSFIEDIKQISESLKIKGYRLSPLFLLRHPLVGLRLLFIPILFRALRTSDELGMAAELKGVGYSRDVSRYRTNNLTWRDAVAGALLMVMITASLVAHVQLPIRDIMGM
ncbi:energy-coupling factor transporter transmembrane component T family protein [Desulfurispira natronophila]|uniref:Energy-coupling factor transport system permease protein n=1 Tax=Desulfurispira natronophila TaxID=682562 RepID=A0A7W7Y3R8_9BACT|nr:energy-coupling factor transporter transmembrane component T [Desulfurispira natronophila]MBB5021538.1 energy-coupling factor transport system permease protein [Desulfurispira natronophila]